MIRFTSEDTIEEGIHQVALEKLKLEEVITFPLTMETFFSLLPCPNSNPASARVLDVLPWHEPFPYLISSPCQDLTKEGEEGKTKKKDVARLLKNALGVELKDKQIGWIILTFLTP